MTTIMPLCIYCLLKAPGDQWTCPAFPHGIPDEIVLMKFSHTKIYPGQAGEHVYTPIDPNLFGGNP